jgi:hypothetical protein
VYVCTIAVVIGFAVSSGDAEESRILLEGAFDPQWLSDNVQVFASQGIGGIVHRDGTWLMGRRVQTTSSSPSTNPFEENLDCILGIPKSRLAQYGLDGFLRFRIARAGVTGCLPWWEDDYSWGSVYQDAVIPPNVKNETFLEQAARFAGAARRNGLKGVTMDIETGNSCDSQIETPSGVCACGTPTLEWWSGNLLFSQDASGPNDNGVIPPYVAPLRSTVRHRGRQLANALADSFPKLEIVALPELGKENTTHSACVAGCALECTDRPLWKDFLAGLVEASLTIPSDRKPSRIIVMMEGTFKLNTSSGFDLTSDVDKRIDAARACLDLGTSSTGENLNDHFEIGFGGWYLGGNGDFDCGTHSVTAQNCDPDNVVDTLVSLPHTIICCDQFPGGNLRATRLHAIPLHACTSPAVPADYRFFTPWDVAEREIAQHLYDQKPISRTQYIFCQNVVSWSDATDYATRNSYPIPDYRCYGDESSDPGMYPPYQYLLEGKPQPGSPLDHSFPCYRDWHSAPKDTNLMDYMQVLAATRPLASEQSGTTAYKLKNPDFEGGLTEPAHIPKDWSVIQWPQSPAGAVLNVYLNPEEGHWCRGASCCDPATNQNCQLWNIFDGYQAHHDTTHPGDSDGANHAAELYTSGPFPGGKGRFYQSVTLEPGTWELGALVRRDSVEAQLHLKFFIETTAQFPNWSTVPIGIDPDRTSIPQEPSQTRVNGYRQGWFFQGRRFQITTTGTYYVGIETEQGVGEYIRVDDITLTRQLDMARNPQFDLHRSRTDSLWMPMYWGIETEVGNPQGVSTHMWPWGGQDPTYATLGKFGPTALQVTFDGQQSRTVRVSQSLYLETGHSYQLSAYARGVPNLSTVNEVQVFFRSAAGVESPPGILGVITSSWAPALTPSFTPTSSGVYSLCIRVISDGSDGVLLDSVEMAPPLDTQTPTVSNVQGGTLSSGRRIPLTWAASNGPITDAIVYQKYTGEQVWRETSVKLNPDPATGGSWIVPFVPRTFQNPQVEFRVVALDQSGQGIGVTSTPIPVTESQYHAEFNLFYQRPGPFALADLSVGLTPADGHADLMRSNSNWSEANTRAFPTEVRPDTIFTYASQGDASGRWAFVDALTASSVLPGNHERTVDMTGGAFGGQSDAVLYVTEYRPPGANPASTFVSFLRACTGSAACTTKVANLTLPPGHAGFRPAGISPGRLLVSGNDSDDFIILEGQTISPVMLTVVPTVGVGGGYVFTTGGPFGGGAILGEPLRAFIGEYSGVATYGDAIVASRSTCSQGVKVKLSLFPGKKSGTANQAALNNESANFCFSTGGCDPSCTSIAGIDGRVGATANFVPGGKDELAIAVKSLFQGAPRDEIWVAASGVNFSVRDTLAVAPGEEIIGMAAGDLSFATALPDGSPDLVVAVAESSNGGGVSLYFYKNISTVGDFAMATPLKLSIADGTYGGRSVPIVPTRILIEDITGDGRPDIVFSFERSIGGVRTVLLSPYGV